MCRHSEAWKDSLRYRRPDLERMAGLRRITLNINPLIGDHGAMALAEALRDDLWLKALDMQNCGISKTGAKAFSDMLLYNTTLIILDVRANPLIDPSLIHSITEQVTFNSKAQASDNCQPEYDWIKLESSRPENKSRKKKVTKALNTSHNKKASIKINGMCYRLKSSRVGLTSQSKGVTAITQPDRGMPWRTAARAIKQRGCFSSHQEQYEPDGSIRIIADPKSSNALEWDHYVDDSTNKENHKIKSVHVLSSRNCQENNDLVNADTLSKNFKVELEHVKRELTQERMARLKADKSVLELTLENDRLLGKVEQLKKKLSLFEDENILGTIESSFKQFHAFLDILRDAGLGQLISLAGIDSSYVPLIDIPSSSKQTASLFQDRSNTMGASNQFSPTTAAPRNKLGQDQLESLPVSYGETNHLKENLRSFGVNSEPNQSTNLRMEHSKATYLQHNPRENLNSTFEISENGNNYIMATPKSPDRENPHTFLSDWRNKRHPIQKDHSSVKNTAEDWETSKTLVKGCIISRPPDICLGSDAPTSLNNSPKSPSNSFFSKDTFDRSKIIEAIFKKTSLSKVESLFTVPSTISEQTGHREKEFAQAILDVQQGSMVNKEWSEDNAKTKFDLDENIADIEPIISSKIDFPYNIYEKERESLEIEDVEENINLKEEKLKSDQGRYCAVNNTNVGSQSASEKGNNQLEPATATTIADSLDRSGLDGRAAVACPKTVEAKSENNKNPSKFVGISHESPSDAEMSAKSKQVVSGSEVKATVTNDSNYSLESFEISAASSSSPCSHPSDINQDSIPELYSQDTSSPLKSISDEDF